MNRSRLTFSLVDQCEIAQIVFANIIVLVRIIGLLFFLFLVAPARSSERNSVNHQVPLVRMPEGDHTQSSTNGILPLEHALVVLSLSSLAPEVVVLVVRFALLLVLHIVTLVEATT